MKVPGQSPSQEEPGKKYDYGDLLKYGQVALAAYRKYETDSASIEGLKELHHQKQSYISVESVAYYDQEHNEIIIGFKGTNLGNWTDIVADCELGFKNIVNLPFSSAYNYYAKAFYLKTMEIAEELGIERPRVTLTGHSLGGYIATYVAARMGVAARVFSAPAMHNISNKSLASSNILNVYREGDRVVENTGRWSQHQENLLILPGASAWIGMENHDMKIIMKKMEEGIQPVQVQLNKNVEDRQPLIVELEVLGTREGFQLDI